MSTSTSSTAAQRASLLASYRQHGYYAPVRALSVAEAAEYRAHLERHEAATGGPLKNAYRQKSHLLFTWLAALVRDPRILDVVEPIVGPDILVWQTAFFIKEANDPSFVSWHQDSTYWGLSEPEVVTAWVAFSASTPQSGCVRVIPGTHKLDQVPHVETRSAGNLLTRGQEITVDIDESQAASMPLAPGELSLHHIRTFHNSEPNRSNDRRIGFAIRYIPTRIRQTEVDGDTATLVRGQDRFGNFELEERPETDLSAAAVAYHAKVTERRAKIYGKLP